MDDVAFLHYPSTIEPKSNVYATESDGLEAWKEYLLNTKGRSKNPMVLLVLSSTTLQYYRKSGVAAFREFPSMIVPTHLFDNEFSGLGWQQYAIGRMMSN